MTKAEALKILEELKNSPNMVKHALACGFVMKDLCIKFSKGNYNHSEPLDEEDWEIVGLLHDADYELTGKSLDRHTEETAKKLKEKNVDQSLIDAIRGHCDKASRTSLMAKAIYAADELTGLIVAAALVQPDKKLKSVTVESVQRKFKDKSFAAGANRDQIRTCESELNIPLEEFVSIVLKSMQDNAKELGL
ncbi:hypothetical protein A3D81_02890 [Candidatus Curtissbacteria bacterium RIFCSPHIGHO2_02_FULL_40_17]|uniref:HD domain-containing protein n=4 Tax=Candidatus Curtissiibacteriota TaxID=1752717 RepID=A0A1F5GIJ7_9BACT|nr:MAG: hypothetical protein A2693_02430 [Candidatus Curtissbacteria bacterium RIFCSPHIGHO2_01_FULL_40_12]OGD91654.1 MAG: hypothetical protein A3D81_02890 [Candidatus Curtissbacteria bacterium RIFCSPHIGHO2_02_FULL_40_17]OGE04530.1 MAG: hypothetical protein A3F45_03390 [Candidatus Curtissbacteria bacterium RIFCSPHIGHO2_12_FULL_41_17]OGE08087.1 MAG: hypothetical protein A3I53_00015 [Candidatus Curtissbacteria bacterium RIFCSPLOWO2_02_FULL_40_13b]